MTRGEYLKYATDFLKSASIETARLDSLILMEFVLDTDRAKILSDKDIDLSDNQQNVLNKLLVKRSKHIPISHITNNAEFYGRNFFINSHVLEPRPESETMIDLLKELIRNDPGLSTSKSILIADIGTGSGALGITAMLELGNVHCDLIDIDDKALKVAKNNVVSHTIVTNTIKGDLLNSNNHNYRVLLCNLPYVPDDFSINLAAGHEPKIAIFGGKDGLDVYRKLFKLMKYRQHKPLYILTEALPTQHAKLKHIASEAGYSLTKSDDFIQLYATE
ncbi:MAG: HemK/PrmC family methyltransferase [Candidatus Saccharibacteria bacterium]